MNPIIEFLIIEKNIPESSIVLLLTLPIIASIIAVWRHIIGLRAFGIYAPILITYAFYHLSLTPGGPDIFQGLKYGFALSITVFLSAMISHMITSKIRLHYLPKMSIIISSVAVSVFCILATAAYFNKGGFTSIDAIAILLLITVSEQFISFYIKKGKKTAFALTLSTLVISTFSYLLITWTFIKDLLFKYPLIPLATVIFNLILGKWTGIRITEYLKFRSILQDESI